MFLSSVNLGSFVIYPRTKGVLKFDIEVSWIIEWTWGHAIDYIIRKFQS